MSHPNYPPVLVSRNGASPSAVRIDFAPGHEDAPITQQDVAAKMRLMKHAESLAGGVRIAIRKMTDFATALDGVGYPVTATAMRKDATALQRLLDAAEGRS